MLNPLVIMAYGIFFCSLIINIWAMRHGVQLKEMALLESLGYIFVPLLSAVLLKEHVSRRMGWGILCIIVGIIIFYQ
jgi:drug/metabolite transporter (DMT)-like permease